MRRIRSVVRVLLTTLVAVGLLTPSGTAVANPPPDTTTYYLALGDSLAFGYPSGVGYADDLQEVLKFSQPGIELIKLGCPGESTVTMIYGKGNCDGTGLYEQYGQSTNQLAAAKWILANMPVSQVTIDIGPNDVLPCFQQGVIKPTCVTDGLAAVQTNLPTILGELRARLDPGAKAAGMSFYDPFLALWPDDAAQQSLGFINALNAIETTNYQQFGFALAPVADVFQTNHPETSPFTLRPINVTRVCVLTLMCTAKADIHPNQLGYWVIAGTFAQTLDLS